MLGIIIQARLGSTRLSGKILKKFQGGTILSFLVEKLTCLHIPIIIATTTSSSDDLLVEYLIKNKYHYYRGSENNVLERYINAAEQYGIDRVIRVTSDNPFTDIDILKKLIFIADKHKDFDYWSFSIEDKPTVLSHIGIFAEIVRLATLKNLYHSFDIKDYTEHVTYGVYMNPDRYRIYLEDITSVFIKYINIRLTVDTAEDYDNIQKILQKFKDVSQLSFFDIGNFVLSRNDLKLSMENIIKSNKK